MLTTQCLLASRLTVIFTLVSASVATAQWRWQNPLPTGLDYLGVAFADPSLGMVVGSDGVILQTEDGGATWFTNGDNRSHLCDGEIRDIVWLSADTAIAVATIESLTGRCDDTQGLYIWRTTDRGDSWTVVHEELGGWNRSRASFAGPNHGMVITSSDSMGLAVLRTADGGLTWTFSIPDLSNPFLLALGISSIDANTAVVGAVDFATGGGAVLQTTDAGGTWSVQHTESSSGVYDVEFIDPNHGIAVGGPSVPGADNSLILTTADGGATWIRRGVSTGLVLSGIACRDMTNCIAVGGQTDFFDFGGDQRLILRTGDGGQSWETVLLQESDASPLWRVAYADADTLVAAGASEGGPTSNSGPGALLRSTDGGKTWFEQMHSVTNETFRGVSFPETDVGTAVGRNGTIVRTTDGGSTWVAQESGTDSDLLGVSFPDRMNGFAVGWDVDHDGAILRTRDGGATWSSHTPTCRRIHGDHTHGERCRLADISCADSQHCMATGEAGIHELGFFAGIILQTEDGGENWVLSLGDTEEEVGPPLLRVSCADAMHCIAGGGEANSSEVITWSTGDGGTTWNRTDVTELSGRIRGIHLRDSMNGFAVGLPAGDDEHDALLRTTDGGATWSRVTLPEDSDWGHIFFNVAFADDEVGLVVGNHSTYRTIDGGDTWTEEVGEVARAGLIHVAVPDRDVATAVGTSGTILRGTTGFVLTPNTVDFGPVLVGEAHGSGSATLVNGSGDEVTISEISEPDAPFTADGGTCGIPPFTLVAGETCELAFSFAPTAAGTVTSVVTLTSDAPTSPHSVTLRGTGSEDRLTMTPDTLDFGGIVAGETAIPLSLSVALTNAGVESLEISAVTVPGAPFIQVAGTCAEPPFELGPFASCTLGYTFSPTETGSFSDVVEVTGDAPGGSGSFGLHGEGLLRELTVPELLDFGSVPVPETVGPLTVTMTNPGDATVVLDGVATPGAPFVLVGTTCGDTLAPGGSCSLDFTFTPAAPGGALAEATVFSNAPSSPHTLTLSGAGLGATIDVDPDSLEATLASGQSEARALEIANLGNDTLEWEVQEVAGTTITHSVSLDVMDDHSSVCFDDATGTTRDAHFLRTFTLTDFGIASAFEVTEVTFGVETLDTTAPITVNLYTLDGELVFDNLDLIGSATVELAPQDLTLVTVPVIGFVPAGATLVVGIEAPDLLGVGEFRPGANNLGQTAPSYVAADEPCIVPEPTSYEVLGDGDLHLVLTVTGTVDCTLPTWASTAPSGGSVPGGESQVADVTFDASGLEPGEYEANLCVNSNDLKRPLTAVPLALTVTPPASAFTPVALAVDLEELLSDGNGVFEPGEQTEVAPTWRNDGTVSHDLGGAASAFTGPAGAEYTIAEPTAAYGLIGPGQSASCRDTGLCYRMDVSDPSARPAAHWDAVFDETLDDSKGTSKTWGLHIGDSFTDVPRGSLFYSWIETLLHNRVTGGCTGTTYCPSTANTRDQMPVFLLKALEGGAYTPPACTGVFNDVPCPSLFANWIEDLASRGVTAGCGGGNYCPGNPVTRDQMAVFLLKTLEGPSYTPPACTGAFGDVPCPSLFAAWIEELAARGITGGCAADPPAYCPAAPVTRAQMAVFVTKTFGLTLYGP